MLQFPFHSELEADCYLDDLYEIDCKSGKPFLKSMGLELLDISPVRSTIRVNQPVISSCQDRTTTEGIFSIPESLPFYFSYDYNYFFGVGCNSLALMSSVDHDNTVLGACFSVCNQRNKTEDGKYCYNGIECCQSGFPSNLKRLNITATSSSLQQDCNYAFLVDLDTYDENFNSSKDVQNWKQVPVALDWRIPNTSYDKLALSKSSTFGSTFYCDTDVNGLVRCYCNRGYEGNPYLPEGCQDLDECKRPDICKSNMDCQNEAGSYTCVPIKKLKIFGIILYISASMGVLFLVSGASWLSIVIRRRMKRKEKNFKRNGGLLLQQQLNSLDGSVDRCKIFNSNELEKATDHFNVNRVVGQGGQGTVYKGMLPDGRIVAVKKSKVVGKAKLEEFINEVVILSQINHRNVVKLLGCCLETEVPLLVYEFISNGTLFHYLHHQNEEIPFTWDVRLRIATEVAEALSYLHSAAYLPIYHRDIKSTNILLDEKYRAKIADFGASKSIAIGQTHISTKVLGTFGYLDPEYYSSSQFTEKSDVYSFGVVLVELLTGQKPVLSTMGRREKKFGNIFCCCYGGESFI
ncbi:putative Kinase [Melia azedarach]|uniref:Kinase n=1 Tax=Melia azedarach TaxID=155640 RepID=A0ACC1Y197_MELAZ|nr:putative Kinase [Melia azedarach]